MRVAHFIRGFVIVWKKIAKRNLELFRIKNGFIETFEKAQKCAEYANRDEVGAEPCLWLPWLVLKYKI